MPTFQDSFPYGSPNLDSRSYNLSRGDCDPSDMSLVTTGNRFTITQTNCTAVQGSVGGRPAIKLATSTGNTDGAIWTSVAAPYILQAGKNFVMKTSFYLSATSGEFLFGLGALTTTPFTDTTDLLYIKKLTGSTTPIIYSRKASGTAATVNCPGTITATTWWEFVMVVKNDPSVAGQANVYLYGGGGLNPGDAIPLLQWATITNNPDTVALCVTAGLRSGATTATNYIGGLSWRQEA